jgi:hypothetical protein
MAETINDKPRKSKKSPVDAESIAKSVGAAEPEAVPVPTIPEGFTAGEVARMEKVREGIRRGEYTDLTGEYKKLLFVQWLIDHDRIRS